MTPEKIYVRLLDNVLVNIPVNAKAIGNNRFEILFDEEYSDDFGDPFYLQEFYPEDIVELGEQIFSDERTGEKKTGFVAKKLIKAGQWPDRKFKEFKFKLILEELNFNKETATTYQKEVEQFKKEVSQGQDFGKFYHDRVEELSKFLTS